MRTDAQPRPIPRWLVVAFLAAATAVGAYYVGVKGVKRSAFNRWRPQILALWNDEDVYYKYAFPTPPIMALILSPFASLASTAGMTAWFVFKVVLTGIV